MPESHYTESLDTSPPYLIQDVATLITTTNPSSLFDLLRLKNLESLAYITSRAHFWVESCFRSVRDAFEFSTLPNCDHQPEDTIRLEQMSGAVAEPSCVLWRIDDIGSH